MRFSFRYRIPWGILLGLVATISIWGMRRIPFIDPMHGFRFSQEGHPDKVTAQHCWWMSRRGDQRWGWIQHFDFDLVTGKIEPWSHDQSIRQMALFSQPPVRKADEKLLRSFQYPNIHAAWSYASDGSGCALVADRYIVGQTPGKLRSVDLLDPRMTRREIDVPGAGGRVRQIPGSRNFVTEQGATSTRLDLVRINDRGDFEFVANWLAATAKYDSSAANDQIASLDPSGTAIEFRAIDDGRLLDTVDLPNSFDVSKHPFNFGWNLFIADISPTEKLLIDLQTKRRLPPPPRPTLQLEPWGYIPSGMSVLNYFDSNQKCGVLIDRATGREIMAYSTEERAPFVVDDHRLLFASQAYGFSAKIMEIPSGKLVRSLVPLWWVPWFAGLAVVVFLFAAIGWMRASMLDNGWAWLDVAVIGGSAILLLSLRLQTGETLDLDRTPHLYIHGICIAGLTLAVIWLMLGQSRLMLRGLPLLLSVSFVVATFDLIIGDRPVPVWQSILLTIVPVAYGSLICFAARMLGVRFRSQPSSQKANSSCNEETSRQSRFQLRDLLLAVASVAVLLAVLRPLLPTMMPIVEAPWLEPRPVLRIVVMLLVGAALLSARRWIFYCAVAVAAISVASLLARDLSWFVGNWDLLAPWISPFIPLGSTCNAGVLSLALFLLPYRLRGWRIGHRADRLDYERHGASHR